MECKKAQPKEVMLPANLAKGRAAAAARGLGEYLMVAGAGAGAGQQRQQYSPYSDTDTPTQQPHPPLNLAHLASLAPNLQQLQMLGVEFSSPAAAAPSFGSVGCKPRGLGSLGFPAVPAVTSSSFGYSLAELVSLPGPGHGYPHMEASSSYQVPVGL